MKVISYYTKNYEKYIKKLIESLHIFNIDHDIIEIKSLGSWQANTQYKPTFIYGMMLKYPKESHFLYLDADAIVKGKIEYDFEHDIGVHYLNGKELLSGTLFLKNNQRVKSLIKLWMLSTIKDPNTWDQKLLQNIVEEHKDDLELSVENIPYSYTKIFDKEMKGKGEIIKPIIEHYQASRREK